MRLLNLLGILPLVAGHTLMTTLYVDGENQGDGVCIRQNRDAQTATWPIEPLANDAMACGYSGEIASSRLCPANQDSTLTFEFRSYPDGSEPGVIAEGHKGPCAVYMKRVEDATADNNAAGGGWFKIYEMTYDDSTSQWCTDKLIANSGFLSVKVPQGIQGGPYLVRTELLALHAAQDTPRDPQFYVGCAQVFVDGESGGDVPTGVVIDASTYDLSIPGLVFNLYETPLALPYPSFGPAVYEPTARGLRSEGKEVVQGTGFEPAGCILVRDDWCGFEVDSYDTQDGCWASSKQCWDQGTSCWEPAPSTGNRVCQVWSDKCTNIDDQCNAGNWNGPPDAGKVLTPALKTISGSMAVFSGGVSSPSGSDSDETKSSSVVSSSAPTSTSTATATATATVSSESSSATGTQAETEVESTDTSASQLTHGHGKGRCKARSSKKRRSHRARK
ncbi:glycosyl hydrolase family 61-domain-containing protein [Aspergillus californicus]